jgi:hypothetical protein
VRLRLLCCAAAIATAAFARERPERFFDARVAPILTKRCLGCHNEHLKNGEISFLDRESLLKGGRRGPAVVPGKPEQSVLVEALRHEGELQMPPGPKLPAKEIKTVTKWIRDGAVWGSSLKR